MVLLRSRVTWLFAALLMALVLAAPLAAQQCATPVNLASNGSFDAGLSGYTNSGSWTFNQTVSPSLYDSRAAVQNPSAAPSGNDAAAYPSASQTAFTFSEIDNGSASLSITNPTGNFLTYFSGQLHIWFDMGWRQAGGTSNPATLQVRVNGTTFLTITTISGTGSGSATATLSNGATLGAGTPASYFNAGGSGALSQWNTIRLIIPYSATTLPDVSWVMSSTSSFADDFAIDRIYVPLCQFPQSLVTNTTNSGMGSLRDAIVWANAQPGPITVTFAIPGAGPHTITLASALPDITANGLTIDGTSQSGTQCRDLWAGNGHDLRINVRGNSGFDGFRFGGANQTIRGLSLTGFVNAVRSLPTSSGTTVQCNYLGLLSDGTSSANTRGMWVNGASARIGGLDPGQGNVISANSIVGIVTINNSTDTAIRGNFIGTDAPGMTPRANGTGINNFNGSASWRDFTRNLMSGNTNGAIVLESDDQISPSTDLVRIQRNIIGFTRDLSALMLNGGDGIRFPSGSIANVLIGGDAVTEGNTITGTEQGISLNNTPNVIIRGNVIARSGQNGIQITAANGVTIGGDSATLGNVIGGNGLSGIATIDGANNITILGNTIGAVTITGGTFENQDRGIFLRNVSNVTIGDGTTGGRNVIARNGLQAIMGTGTGSGITINGNLIGTDATGNSATTNGARLIAALRDAITFQEGGTFTNLTIRSNVIGGHEGALIKLDESTATGVIIRGNAIGVGADGTTPIVAANGNSLIAMGGGTRSFANVEIGGPDPGDANVIAYGGQNGITINTVQTGNRIIGNTIRNNSGNGILLLDSTRVAIISNRIFGNGLLGIELGLDGVTPNDTGDGDSGPNDLLNFPAITSVNVAAPNQLAYNITLDAPAAADGYRVEFFVNSTADPSGHGEGERYLGHVDIAHAGGAQTFTGTLTTLEPVSIGDIVAATTTRRTGGGAWDITSEFSAFATADGVAALTVAMTSDVFDPPAENPFATPGNDIVLTTTISNVGSGSTDADSVFAVISVDANHVFFNDATPAFGGVVGFTSSSPSLTFTPGTDLRFSSDIAAPTGLGHCTYTPQSGYDPQVRHVCVNPKGTLPSGLPDGQFTLRIRSRIN